MFFVGTPLFPLKRRAFFHSATPSGCFSLCLERPRKSPKLPAPRADVTAAGRARPPRLCPAFSPLSRRFLAAASKIARFFHFCRFLISVAERIIPSAVCSTFATPATLPHGGATCGFEASGGYALGCAAKAPQTADTGATAWERCFACLLNLCSSSNRRISALPHPRSASASAGHSPVGALPESAEL